MQHYCIDLMGCMRNEYLLKVKVHTHYETGPVFTKLFQVQDQDQDQVSKWIISGLFHILCSIKLDVCIHWHGKCCSRPKMHEIKEHDGDNQL